MLLFAATEEAGFIGLVSRSRSTRRFLERLVGVIKCLQYSGHVLLWSDQKTTCLLWCHRCWCQKNNIPKQCLLWFSMLKLSFGLPVTFSPQIDICLASKCWHQCHLPWFFEAKSRLSSVNIKHFGCDYITLSVPFSSRDCTTKDRLFGGDVVDRP